MFRVAFLGVLLPTLAACSGSIGDAGGDGGAPGDVFRDGPIVREDAPPGVVLTCDDTYEAVQPWVYGSKIKDLLTGLPLTNEELASLTTDPEGLRTLVEQWLDTEQADVKLLSFFATMFQQDGFENQALTDQYGLAAIQFGDYPDAIEPGRYDTSLESIYFRTFRESFARMAMEIFEEGRPFDEVLTTQEVYLTTAQIIGLTVQDNNEHGDDNEFQWRTRSGLPAVVYQDTTPVPLSRSLDPTDPEFFHFYVGGRAPNDVVHLEACDGRFENNPATPQLHIAWLALNGWFVTPMGSCRHRSVSPDATPRHYPLLELSDYFDFRKVRIRRPNAAAGEAPNEMWELERLRGLGKDGADNDLLLEVPRVGFFTTPAFFATWPSNQDNQARVTANQTLIVALGESFDDSDMTVPINEDALAEEHAGPETECYRCHVNLDPMRQYFRRSYSYFYHRQTVPAAGEPDPFDIGLDPSFAFRGFVEEGNDIFDLADTLTRHPLFASAMVQKVCYYATSQECPEDSVVFREIVERFRVGLNFRDMMVDLLSSPLVTGLTCVEGGAGDVPSISRRRHFCQVLNNRLGIGTDVDRPDVCGDSFFFRDRLGWQGLMNSLVAIVPDDGYSRGDSAPITITEPSLFTSKAAEAMCARLSLEIVGDGEEYPYSGDGDVDAAIDSWAAVLLGLAEGDPRREDVIAALHRHYDAARNGDEAVGWTGTSSAIALQSTFISACMSSANLAMGL